MSASGGDGHKEPGGRVMPGKGTENLGEKRLGGQGSGSYQEREVLFPVEA